MTSRTMGVIDDGIGLAPLVQLASEGEPHDNGYYERIRISLFGKF